MESTKFLIKINTLNENVSIESLKRELYNTHSLFHMHQVNNYILEGECKHISIDTLRDFTFINECKLTLIYYNLMDEEKISKIIFENGHFVNEMTVFFSEEMESELLRTNNRECFFDLFKSVKFNTFKDLNLIK